MHMFSPLFFFFTQAPIISSTRITQTYWNWLKFETKRLHNAKEFFLVNFSITIAICFINHLLTASCNVMHGTWPASFRGNRDSVLGDECGQQQGWQNLAMKFDEVWQFLWLLTPHTLPILWMVAKCCTTNRVVFQPYKWDWTTYRLQDFYGFLPSFHWIGVREILHNLIIYPVPLSIYIYNGNLQETPMIFMVS